MMINGLRCWIETKSSLKVVEYKPATSDTAGTCHVLAQPDEPFSLRYDHVPITNFDCAWRTKVRLESDPENEQVQYGGPPIALRTSRGQVKVRAMRVGADGVQRELVFSPSDLADHTRPVAQITLSLHLCTFVSTTTEVPANDGTGRMKKASCWNWSWRDENPLIEFTFVFGTREYLESTGVVPMKSRTALPPKSIKPPKSRNPSLSETLLSPRSLVRYRQSLPFLHYRSQSNSSMDDYSD